ncbi:peptidase C15, pyroglutamyl peptidase I-like protein [Dendrothele bispora CBS 962.96]|uniref:Peptidase C15, pyroglutamyl peptidase I-like protein n=1 Tax=Dendrothele bispora (strain CBS 962.96) TaxID=1314807 RepID=A0A4V6T5R7_DENBC|nr:peptidase C15, pyroglutamyl peptidase I-like protein [Dendrothele bispora CBS 962.96]
MSTNNMDGESSVFNVLLTGFGPSSSTSREENPSWLAVKPLHKLVIPLDPHPVVIDGQVVMRETTDQHRLIQISALQIPMDYEMTSELIPRLHLRPPQLPDSVKDDFFPIPPDKGYDFIFHVGVVGRGPLRMEKMGHKLGYFMKDVNGKLAPTVRAPEPEFGSRPESDVSVGETFGRDQLGFDMVESSAAGDMFSARPNRGFGVGYEKFSEDIFTDIDVSRLVLDLKRSGIEQIYTSMDAGHYLSDFVYYCSLAESKRNRKPYERGTTQVLFLHCPPVAQPLTTEEVTDAIQRIVVWVCGELAELQE